MASTLTIRPATASDVPGIAAVLVDTWRSTFRGLLSDEFLDTMSAERQETRYRTILGRRQVCCFVAVDEIGRVVGFCCGGPNRSSIPDVPAEVYALYVREARQGAGLGRRLFGAATRQLLSTLGPGLVVWVIASNPSRAFYGRLGGQEVAREELCLGDDKVVQIAYTWAPEGR